MRHLAAVLAILLSFLASSAEGEDKPPLKKWFGFEDYYGPMDDTHVMKFTDVGPGYVVMCYLYVPASVGTDMVCRGGGRCDTQFRGDIGSISCVNVMQPLPPPAAEPSSATTPAPTPASGTKQH